MNKWVEEYLRHFCHDAQKSWDKWLALAEFCYNSTKHLSIDMSLFEAMYRCKVGMPLLIAEMAAKNQQATNDLESMDALVRLAKKNMQDAQAKKYADECRRYLFYEEGDYVHLHLHKNQYASLKGNTNTKLAHIPYRVIY